MAALRPLLATGEGFQGTCHGDTVSTLGAAPCLRLLDLHGLWGLLASFSATALLGRSFCALLLRYRETVLLALAELGGFTMMSDLSGYALVLEFLTASAPCSHQGRERENLAIGLRGRLARMLLPDFEPRYRGRIGSQGLLISVILGPFLSSLSLQIESTLLAQ